VVLVVLIAASIWRFRQVWMHAQEREQALMRQALKPVPPPPMGRLAPAQPVLPASYLEVAQKMLFSKDRNPDILVETAPPPQPKPMPALPRFHGVMNLGDGPSAILSEKADSQHREYRPGQSIGEFKLLAVTNREIVLEWDGKPITKLLEEMIDRSPPAGTPQAAARSQEPPPPPKPAASAKPGPGVDVGRGFRACQPGDTSPPGTVMDGVRKVVSETPFGTSCRWEQVQ
jgi:hypothetical protein